MAESIHNKLPERFHALFWDTDANKIDIRLHARAVIARLMLFVNDDSVEWIKETYDRELILNVLNTWRELRVSFFFSAERRKRLEDYFLTEENNPNEDKKG